MQNFETKTPTDGFIHIHPVKDVITKVKPPDQMTVDLMYCATNDIFLDADEIVYVIKKNDKHCSATSDHRK